MDITGYIVYIIPLVVLLGVLLMLKFCCALCSCMDDPIDTLSTREHPSVYVIPISADQAEYDGSDQDSVEVDANAPPPYDSLDPPPLYSEWKWNLPKVEPPAYADLEFTATALETGPGVASTPDMQHVSWNEL